MNKLFIELGKEKLYITLTDGSEKEIKTVTEPIPTESNGGVPQQDASDWWVICAGTVRSIAESGILHPGDMKEIRLCGNKDGAVMLDSNLMPVCAAVVECDKSIAFPGNCSLILSPVSYLRYMLTGELTAEKDEYIIKNRAAFPGVETGRVCDLSFEYFELSKEAAFLMRLKRPVTVKAPQYNS